MKHFEYNTATGVITEPEYDNVMVRDKGLSDGCLQGQTQA